MFEKLKFESLRLQKDWHNSYNTFNFLVTAWHLYHDWRASDHADTPSRIKRHFNQLPSEMQFVLDIVRDLVNGSKHFRLDTKAANKRRITETHTGKEVGWYKFFFHEKLPGVTVETNWYFSIRVLHNLVMKYFEWAFDETKLAKDFPIDLLEAILYCNIAKRTGKISSVARGILGEIIIK